MTSVRRSPRVRPTRRSPTVSLGTFDGLRRAQHAEFMALSFREKLERLEQMAEVAERLRLRGG